MVAGSIKGSLEGGGPTFSTRLVWHDRVFSLAVLLHGEKHGECKGLALTRSLLE